MGMTIEMKSDDRGPLIRVGGEIDMDSSPDLKRKILAGLRGANLLRADLSGVTYIDSSGVAVLIQGLKDAQQQKAGFILVNPSKSVREVLELAMLDQVFSIEDAPAP